MILSIFGFLVDPTDDYKSDIHRTLSNGFVWFITTTVACVTPLAFLILGVLLFGQNVPLFQPLMLFMRHHPIVAMSLITWIAIEVMCRFYMWHMKRRFGVPRAFPSLSRKEREEYLGRVIEHCENPLKSLVRWFHKCEPQDVGVECMEEWLSWAFFSKDRADLVPEEEEELVSHMDKLIEKYPDVGRPSAEHVKYQLKFMRLHFDKMVVQHKPAIAYGIISLMQFVGSTYLQYIGFNHVQLPGKNQLSYWCYLPPNATVDPSKRPIFIVHGIGIGVTMYINIIKTVLAKDPTRPVFILELPNISLKIVSSVATMDETLEVVDYIFARHNLTDCSWLAHSYGTIVTAWVLKERKDYVNKICFVDPVCFALWEPDLIYNFLYRPPSGPIHRLCQFYVAQDLLVSYTLFRNFWWLQNILFPEDITCPANVFVSSHDFIIDAHSTQSYLQKRLELDSKKDRNANGGGGGQREFKIVKMDGLSHGSFLNSPKYAKEIVDCL